MNYTIIATPQTELLYSEFTCILTFEQPIAYNIPKDALILMPDLQCPNYNYPFVIHYNAFDKTIGADIC